MEGEDGGGKEGETDEVWMEEEGGSAREEGVVEALVLLPPTL